MDNQFSDDGFIPKHGGYRNLLTYQKAEIILLGTMYFCEKYISKFDRTYDQMVQAARSGERNILEGSMASNTSKDRKTLEHWQWNTMKLITEGTYPLSGKYLYGCLQNLKTLKEAGFEE